MGIDICGMTLDGGNQGGGELYNDLQISILSNNGDTQLLLYKIIILLQLYCDIYIVAWVG